MQRSKMKRKGISAVVYCFLPPSDSKGKFRFNITDEWRAEQVEMCLVECQMKKKMPAETHWFWQAANTLLWKQNNLIRSTSVQIRWNDAHLWENAVGIEGEAYKRSHLWMPIPGTLGASSWVSTRSINRKSCHLYCCLCAWKSFQAWHSWSLNAELIENLSLLFKASGKLICRTS